LHLFQLTAVLRSGSSHHQQTLVTQGMPIKYQRETHNLSKYKMYITAWKRVVTIIS